MADDKIIARKDGAIGWLIFNQPEKRNALSLAMSERAAQVLDEYAADDDVRVVVLAGTGGKSFVSGADISEFEESRSSKEKAAEYTRRSQTVFATTRNCPKPTIAMIQGFCMGGGMALAAACDIRICSDDSVFAIPAGRLSIVYRVDFTQWVTELVGPSRTKEILFTARRYDAKEALAMGLVNRVTTPDELESFVTDYANTIANNAPLSVLGAKVIVNEIMKDESQRDVEKCRQLSTSCYDSEDFKEGRRAFMEKRQPVFVGR